MCDAVLLILLDFIILLLLISIVIYLTYETVKVREPVPVTVALEADKVI